MRKGGAQLKAKTTQSVALANIVTAFVLGLYTLLVIAGVVRSDHYFSAIAALVISCVWLVVSVLFYFTPTKTRPDLALRIVLIHFFAITSFSFVVGYLQPFSALYALLILVSQFFFGMRGFWYSAGFLAVSALADALFRMQFRPETLFENSLAVFVSVFLAFTVLRILGAQETRRQSLVKSRERERMQYDRLLTVMNNLSDAAFSTDTKGIVQMYNAAALELIDTNDSIRGKNIGDLFKLSHSADDKKVSLVTVMKQATRTTRRDDLNHTYSDGESIRLEMTFAPIKGNYSSEREGEENGGYIVIMRDVTKQKSLEEERDEFISVVSHELRTPITVVEGSLSNLDVLMHRDAPADKKILGDMISSAHDQVLYLAKMVNDLSTLSRAERGVADSPESIDVKELIHIMHRRHNEEAEKHGLRLNIDIAGNLGSVHVSRLYLEELLQNFITNAIKYTHEGDITIIARKSKGVVTFSVKDTGIGMSRTDQVKIFHKFYRSEDYRIRETNGTGLGLYVSSKLARKLHTQIELTSRLNHGSTFSFELPSE